MSSHDRHRLLAMMFTDIVGYADLMHGDEEAAKSIRRRHRQAVEVAVEAHGGELLPYPGGGSLTMFPTVYDAVRAAVEVQRDLRQEPVVPLRIGVHFGDISFDTQGAYGDSMSVASRIHALGTAGSILVSAKAHDAIKDHSEIRTTRLGDFELEGVEESVELYAVVSDSVSVPTESDVLEALRTLPTPGSDLLLRLKVALAGRYDVDRRLGEGGMATVYLAQDVKHGRAVAVKVLHPDVAAAVGPARFEREIEIAARLTHPNVLPVHDSGVADGLLYFVMPYVEGESLRVRLARERQLPLDDAIRIAREVAEALAYAHEHGVVHRDVKPANVLMEAGRAVLTDFGIAKLAAAADDEPLTQTGVSVGTPAYMSPEQAAGEADIDGRSDQYSLACVLYEMLAGEPPYTGGSAQAVLSRKLVEPVKRLRTVRDTVSEALEQVTRKALARVPADRFRTMREFADALADLPGYRIPRRVRGPKLATALLGTAAAVVALTLGYVEWPWRPVADLSNDIVAVFPFENLSGDSDLDNLGEYAAFSIFGGLGRMNEASALEWNTVLRARQESGQNVSLRDVAAALGAGTVVTGVYLEAGDRIEFQAQLSDVASQEVLHSVETTGASAAPAEAVEELTQRVMGAMALRLDDPERVRWVTRPPTYAAYRAFQQGDERFMAGDLEGAAEKFDEAYNLDTTFVDVILQSTFMYYDLTRWHEMDSTLATVEPRVAELRPVNRAWVRYLRAILAANATARVEAIQAVYEIDPTKLAVLVAQELMRAGRANAVLQFWDGLDEDARSALYIGGWNAPAKALHVLGRYEEQLALGREITEKFPDQVVGTLHEALALVGLGRLEEMNERLQGMEELGMRGLWTPGGVLSLVSIDLLRRGYEDEARAMIDRAVTWYRFGDPRSSEPPPGLLLAAGHIDEALQQLDRRLTEDPESLELHGFLGFALALNGDRAGAEAQARWLEELDDPYLFGRDSYWRACIQANLGREASALQLLRTALLEGQGYDWLYDDWHFAPLWGDEAFQEVIRPRD